VSFGVPSVDPDTTINYSDISDPVLKATIASFVPRGLNVVFKILMFMSAGLLTTGYTDLIGLPITLLAACMVHVRDGNCLFNDTSLVLFGHENASSEIRLKTFFELFDNAAFYERIHVKSKSGSISCLI
jgi:hypothetical protein